MNKNSLKSAVITDSCISIVILLSLYLLFLFFDVFDSLVSFVSLHESWELDEVILTVLVSPLVFIWFSIRRWNDAKYQYKLLMKKEEEFSQKLKYDEVTQLPNNSYFEIILNEAINKIYLDNKHLVILLIEVDNFLNIETFFSSDEINNIERSLTSIFKQSLPEKGRLFRVAKDEFVILFNTPTESNIKKQIRTIRETLSTADYLQEFAINLTIGASHIGYKDEKLSPNSFFRQANHAIYSENKDLYTGVYLHNKQKAKNKLTNSLLRKELTRAIQKDELELYLQPQINTLTNQINGAEALIRWNHPDKGLLLPDQFIHLADNNPLAITLGEWVILTALKILSLYEDTFSISVNIFPSHFLHANFSKRLNSLLKQYPEVAPNRLKIEIIESGSVSNYSKLKKVMESCIKLGVTFSLDDFGTGYSTLNQLRILPVTQIKIDRSFINEFLSNETDYKMVNSIITLAKSFKLEVVAEGIENEKQSRSLIALGCFNVQGYYFSKPLPKGSFDKWKQNFEKKYNKTRIESNQVV